MEENAPNRMAIPHKRGRPPKFGVGNDEPQAVEPVEVEQPALIGIRCPACGRGMIPRRDSVVGQKCYAHCTLCGARMALTFTRSAYSAVRLIR